MGRAHSREMRQLMGIHVYGPGLSEEIKKSAVETEPSHRSPRDYRLSRLSHVSFSRLTRLSNARRRYISNTVTRFTNYSARV